MKFDWNRFWFWAGVTASVIVTVIAANKNSSYWFAIGVLQIAMACCGQYFWSKEVTWFNPFYLLLVLSSAAMLAQPESGIKWLVMPGAAALCFCIYGIIKWIEVYWN